VLAARLRPTREAEEWIGKRSEEVMEAPSFGGMRADIWRLLRHQMQKEDSRVC
jgi:hypothetical protein